MMETIFMFHFRMVSFSIAVVAFVSFGLFADEMIPQQYPMASVKIPVYRNVSSIPENSKAPYAYFNENNGVIYVREFLEEHQAWAEWYSRATWLVRVDLETNCVYEDDVYQYTFQITNLPDSRFPVHSFIFESLPDEDDMRIILPDYTFSIYSLSSSIWGRPYRIINKYNDEEGIPSLAPVGTMTSITFSSENLPGPGRCFARSDGGGIYPSDKTKKLLGNNSEPVNEDLLWSAIPKLLDGNVQGIGIVPIYDVQWALTDMLDAILRDFPLFLEARWTGQESDLAEIRDALLKTRSCLDSTPPNTIAAKAALQEARALAQSLYNAKTIRREAWDVLRFATEHIERQIDM